MSRSSSRHLMLTTFLAMSLVVASVGHMQRSEAQGLGQQQSYQATIGFESTVSDKSILQVLRRHGIQPRAVFMWSSGLSGTYRAYSAKSSDVFLREARAKAIETLEKSLEGNTIRLQRFSKVYTEAQVVANPNIEQEARSLLNIRALLEDGLSAAETGKPLIYALEVSSSNGEQLQSLDNDPTINVFQSTSADKVPPQALKPAAYQKERVDPGVRAAGARDLYQRIKTLANQ